MKPYHDILGERRKRIETLEGQVRAYKDEIRRLKCLIAKEGDGLEIASTREGIRTEMMIQLVGENKKLRDAIIATVNHPTPDCGELEAWKHHWYCAKFGLETALCNGR